MNPRRGERSPWRHLVLPARRQLAQAPLSPFTTNHRATLQHHHLELATIVIYSPDGQPIAAVHPVSRKRSAL